ncbi:MAG: ComF family protein [Acidipropionibacterium sp.]|jgi:predicted amidophosphoribosyltransferase|nr:ComF family protein [Acidipropionibacterium sp.]
MLEPLADLLLGACCPGCGRPGGGLCPHCLEAVRPRPRVIVDGPPPVLACLPYRDPLPALVTAYKDRGAGWLGDQLAAWLAVGLAAAVAAAQTPVTLVPMPSDRAAVRRRGADHCADLVTAASGLCGLPRGSVQQLLRRTRRVRDQIQVGHEERAANQAGSMRADPYSPGSPDPGSGQRPVVLIDDIRTTGASLDEGVRALEAAGHRILVCLVLADAEHPARWA